MGFLKISLFILFLTSYLQAMVIDGTLAANSTSYKESNQSRSGLSARLRYREFGAGADSGGQMILADMPGISPFVGQFSYGYGWSTKGNVSYDFAGGVSYSMIWSLGALLTAGVSFEVGSGMVISLPVILYTSMGIQFTPYFGWRF